MNLVNIDSMKDLVKQYNVMLGNGDGIKDFYAVFPAESPDSVDGLCMKVAVNEFEQCVQTLVQGNYGCVRIISSSEDTCKEYKIDSKGLADLVFQEDGVKKKYSKV